jgi:hypothetical protein
MDAVSEAAAHAEGDDEVSGADGAEHSPAVEHLQTAARELVAAARSFLDVVEEVVEDPDRLSGAATSVVDLLRDGLGAVARPSSPLEPWERAAWSAPEEPAADQPLDDEMTADEPTADEERSADEPTADEGEDGTPRPRAARARASARNGGAASSRVRRISVD